MDPTPRGIVAIKSPSLHREKEQHQRRALQAVAEGVHVQPQRSVAEKAARKTSCSSNVGTPQTVPMMTLTHTPAHSGASPVANAGRRQRGLPWLIVNNVTSEYRARRGPH